jgi:hypothetical protein
MKTNLLKDIGNDNKFGRNMAMIFIFTALVFLSDYLVSTLLVQGVNRYYGISSDSEILLVGHSHLMLALDKKMLENTTGKKVSKYTREGVNISDRKVMVRHYFETCSRKPEIVILGIDPWLFTDEGLSQNSWRLLLPFMNTPSVRTHIKEEASSSTEYLLPQFIRCNRFNLSLLNASLRGYLGNWNNIKIGFLDTARIRSEISSGKFRRIKVNQELVKDFTEMMIYLEEQNARVLLLNTPIYQPIVTAQSTEYTEVMSIIDSISKSVCSVSALINLDPEFSDKSVYFYDPIHLNRDGQISVSKSFSQTLNNLISTWDSEL